MGAILYCELGNHEESNILADRLFAKYSNKPIAYVTKARINLILDQPSEALKFIREGLKIEPGNNNLLKLNTKVETLLEKSKAPKEPMPTESNELPKPSPLKRITQKIKAFLIKSN